MVVDVRAIDRDLREVSERLQRAELAGDFETAAMLSAELDKLLDARTVAVAEQDQCLR